ncbi:hypothetical protein KEM55_001876 [Ascosphaera atra]|nr:hypothetical protein KEM55_001876 [Ascosphaera atra]
MTPQRVLVDSIPAPVQSLEPQSQHSTSPSTSRSAGDDTAGSGLRDGIFQDTMLDVDAASSDGAFDLETYLELEGSLDPDEKRPESSLTDSKGARENKLLSANDKKKKKRFRYPSLAYKCSHALQGRLLTSRDRLSHSQTRYLMSEFARHAHPDATQRERLAKEIPGLTPRQVQVWFQNRRAKLKRLALEERERILRSQALYEFEAAQAASMMDNQLSFGAPIPWGSYPVPTEGQLDYTPYAVGQGELLSHADVAGLVDGSMIVPPYEDGTLLSNDEALMGTFNRIQGLQQYPGIPGSMSFDATVPSQQQLSVGDVVNWSGQQFYFGQLDMGIVPGTAAPEQLNRMDDDVMGQDQGQCTSAANLLTQDMNEWQTINEAALEASMGSELSEAWMNAPYAQDLDQQVRESDVNAIPADQGAMPHLGNAFTSFDASLMASPFASSSNSFDAGKL